MFTVTVREAVDGPGRAETVRNGRDRLVLRFPRIAEKCSFLDFSSIKGLQDSFVRSREHFQACQSTSCLTDVLHAMSTACALLEKLHSTPNLKRASRKYSFPSLKGRILQFGA